LLLALEPGGDFMPGKIDAVVDAPAFGKAKGFVIAPPPQCDGGQATVMVVPNSGGGGGNTMLFESPLMVATATAFKFTASSGVSTLYCNAQGFDGN
jgi:hypothetical protein